MTADPDLIRTAVPVALMLGAAGLVLYQAWRAWRQPPSCKRRPTLSQALIGNTMASKTLPDGRIIILIGSGPDPDDDRD